MTFLLIAAGVLLLLPAAGCLFVRDRRALRGLAWGSLGLNAAGAALIVAALILFARANRLTENAELLRWAEDMFRIWLRYGGGFSAVVLLCTVSAVLIRHKLRTVRTLGAAAAGLLVLIVGAAYAVLCEAETVNPALWVRLSTLGFAGLVQLCCTLELFFALRTKPDAPAAGKKKQSRR